MAFNHDSPYSSPPPLASRKAQVVPALTPAALQVRMGTGMSVWWHPAGPTHWLPPSASEGDPEDAFCHGCHSYICEDCDETYPWGEHLTIDHVLDEE